MATGQINQLQAMLCLILKVILKFVMGIDLLIKLADVAEVCLGFAIYDIQLPDISLTNFYITFKIKRIIACSRFIRPFVKIRLKFKGDEKKDHKKANESLPI